MHNISVVCLPRLARSPGGLGGRSRIEFIVSPRPRRRHNESHFAAEPPERAFLAKPFFARAKNGVNSGRRSHKISVSEAKCNICRHKRAGALHLITACGRSCLAAARVSSSSASGTAGLGSHWEPIQYRAPASQPSEGKPRRMFAAGCLKGTLRPVRVVRPVLNPPADTTCGCGVSPIQRGSRGHPPCSSFFF